MAEVKLIAAVCPRCGANLRFPDGMRKAHCMYCGAQVFMHHERGGPTVQCRTCLGTGKLELCHSCRGTGKCTWSNSSVTMIGNMPLTGSCKNGSCSACGGSGMILLSPCSICHGTGKCPECRGSARCTVCKGFGMLPSSVGKIKCKACGGDGVVDDIDSDGPSLEKCPTCGASWVPEGSFCRRCGHPRTCPRCGVAWNGGAVFCAHCGYSRGPKA